MKCGEGSFDGFSDSEFQWNPIFSPNAIFMFGILLIIYFILFLSQFTNTPFLKPRKSLKIWLLFLMIVNIVQAIGTSLLWFWDRSVGFCFSAAGLLIYASLFVPLLFITFRSDIKYLKHPEVLLREEQANTNPVILKEESPQDGYFQMIEKAKDYSSLPLIELTALYLHSHGQIYEELPDFGDVSRSRWEGNNVAIKKVFENFDVNFLRDMRTLSDLRHPCLVNCLGFCLDPSGGYLVTPFMERGSVYDLLHNMNNEISLTFIHQILCSTASGCSYLHSRSVVHQDLRTHNLLLNEEMRVKVAYFGLGKFRSGSAAIHRGTAQWKAPEVLRNEPSNEKADLWSFGVIIWELLTRQVPFEGVNSIKLLNGLKSGLKLTFPPECEENLVRMAKHCWARNPSQRPAFSVLLANLEEMRPALNSRDSFDSVGSEL